MRDNIVIFYPHIGEYGGIERNLIALALKVKDKGMQMILVCYYDKINISEYSKALIQTVILNDSKNPFSKASNLKRWLLSNRFVGMPLFFGAKAGFYGALGFIHTYALHYTDPPNLLSGYSKNKLQGLAAFRAFLSNKIIQKGVSNAQVCITMTKWNAKELQEIYKRSFEVIYQGGVPPRTIVKCKQRFTSETLHFFSICRLNTSKNLSWILKAAFKLKSTNIFKRKFRHLSVTIAGKGPDLENLVRLSEQLGMKDIVQFPGFLDDVALEKEYEKADLFLVPGRQGYGLPVLEALYRYVPVIMNVESRISEILQNNPWVSISNNDSDAFSCAVITYIENAILQYPSDTILHSLPTEDEWANNIGQLCNWWD